jgi:hypothetical protein
MSREEAQRFNLPVAFTTETGAEGFATQLDHLRQMAQQVENVTGKTEELTAAQIAAANAGQQFALTVSQGLTRAITGASTFKDALTGIIRQLAEAIIQAVIFRSITGAIGAPGTAGEAGTGLPRCLRGLLCLWRYDPGRAMGHRRRARSRARVWSRYRDPEHGRQQGRAISCNEHDHQRERRGRIAGRGS